MDFEALQKFAVENFSQYFSVAVDTLTQPRLRFAPIVVRTGGGGAVPLPEEKPASRLNPQLVAFAVTSMFLGLSLNALVSRPYKLEIIVIEVAGLLFWVVYASLVHLFCRMARGQGSFLETVSITIQVFATLYVVCSAVTTTLGLFILLKPVNTFVAQLGTLGEIVAERPVVLFFVIHTVLLVIYLPLALKPIHNFNWRQQIGVAMPTGLLVLLHGIAMVAATGALWSVDPERPIGFVGQRSAELVAVSSACVSRACGRGALSSSENH
jgi:hypothetical protein